MKAIEKIQQYYLDRKLAAKQWKRTGGKVVGYFCNNVPEEMILAGGFLPFRVTGDPMSSTIVADEYVEPFFEPDVRSMLNLLLTTKYDFLDFLVIPHSRDAILGLYYHLKKIKDINPNLNLPPIHLLDFLHTRYGLTDLYERNRLGEFKMKLEEWSGEIISEEALSAAISIVHENRLLLKSIAAMRRTDPPCISGVQALQIIGTSMFMHKQQHNQLLKQIIEEKDKLKPDDSGIRIFIVGSPVDNLQFYRLVESCGVTIVGEDNCWGNRCFDNPVNIASDPLEVIAKQYINKSLCPRMHPLSLRVNYGLEKALEVKAQGVIFFFLEWDNALAWEYPDQKKAFEDLGIPTLCFQNQPYLLSEEIKNSMKIRLEEFIYQISKYPNTAILPIKEVHNDE
jgi:benzoyl-CoA reductase/2-hydroxyglutaryl-CoA dehydratase subunit BcrC/BadD/HgdB